MPAGVGPWDRFDRPLECNPGFFAETDSNHTGLYIVALDTWAENAGLRLGDRVVAFNGIPVHINSFPLLPRKQPLRWASSGRAGSSQQRCRAIAMIEYGQRGEISRRQWLLANGSAVSHLLI